MSFREKNVLFSLAVFVKSRKNLFIFARGDLFLLVLAEVDVKLLLSIFSACLDVKSSLWADPVDCQKSSKKEMTCPSFGMLLRFVIDGYV